MNDQEEATRTRPGVLALDEQALDQVVAGNPMATHGSTATGRASSSMLSSVARTRSEISMTFARNARA